MQNNNTQEVGFIAVDNYCMGADYNSDEGQFCIMVMRKETKEFVCMYNGRTNDPKEYEKEIEKVAAFYKIPDNHILKEKY